MGCPHVVAEAFGADGARDGVYESCGARRLVVDATGVGATGVGATGMERARGSGERWQVPRKDLLAGLEVLLETGELRISKRLVEAGRLVKELTSIRFGRGESGEHDDLTMAVWLAC